MLAYNSRYISEFNVDYETYSVIVLSLTLTIYSEVLFISVDCKAVCIFGNGELYENNVFY